MHIRGHRPAWVGKSVGRSRSIVLGIGLLLTAVGIVAVPGAAWAAPFQRGDVFVASNGGVQEYSPSGQLLQTIPGTSGATILCFDPSGKHLVVPGVGLFDSAGNVLPSQWGAPPDFPPYDCAIDGLGHVYLAQGPNGFPNNLSCVYADTCWGTIREYDLVGDLLHSFTVDTSAYSYGGGVFNLATTPDPCTIYYGLNGQYSGGLFRFNVCNNAQETPLSASTPFDDQLKVLPDWRIAWTFDEGVMFFDPSGQVIWSNSLGGHVIQLRKMDLDPDGASLWVGGSCGPAGSCGPSVWRIDFTTQQVLANWPTPGGALGAVYGPPLLGNAGIEGSLDSDAPGTAEAFIAQAGYSGRTSQLHLYVDSASTANKVVVGIYSNRAGGPGELLERGTITNVQPGTWNYVGVPSRPITAGQLYWIAVLAPSGGGTVAFRDRRVSGLALVSAQHNLSDLPTRWSSGRLTLSGRLSAYGS